MSAAPLRSSVLAALRGHGIEPAGEDTPSALRDRVNDLYLEEVRRLKAKQRAGEIPLRDYARVAQELKERFPLLGLPLHFWIEPE